MLSLPPVLTLINPADRLAACLLLLLLLLLFLF